MNLDLPIFPDLLATPWRFLWHVTSQTAILADLHLGSFATAAGPKVQAAWGHLLTRLPRQVIFAGDVFDSPDVPPAILEDGRQMLARLPRTCRVILTPGNHDPGNLGNFLHLESSNNFQLGDYLISHGHILPGILSTAPHLTWIVGHQHPAVTFRTRVQSAKMACYALCDSGRTRPRTLLLPAFNRDAGGPLGSNLLSGAHWLLPVSRPAPAAMHIFGLIEPADEPPQILDFGKLSALAP